MTEFSPYGLAFSKLNENTIMSAMEPGHCVINSAWVFNLSCKGVFSASLQIAEIQLLATPITYNKKPTNHHNPLIKAFRTNSDHNVTPSTLLPLAETIGVTNVPSTSPTLLSLTPECQSLIIQYFLQHIQFTCCSRSGTFDIMA